VSEDIVARCEGTVVLVGFSCRVVLFVIIVPHRIRQLIALVPRIQLLVICVIAQRCGAIEWIGKQQRIQFQTLARVQVERKANCCVQDCHRIDGVEHAAHDEHFTNLLNCLINCTITLRDQSTHLAMVQTHVEAVLRFQCVGINFRYDCVVGLGRAVNQPNAIVVGTKVHDVVR